MATSVLSASPKPVDDASSVSLLGGFNVRVAGATVALPMHSRRVLAYLSLDKTAEEDCDRSVLAERLWPDVQPERARASLRTALWRIRRADPRMLRTACDRITLCDHVKVDVHQYKRQAERLLTARADCPRERAHLMARNSDLLPGWDESWLLLAREQLRQLRLHALEVSGRRLADLGHYPEAIDVMLMVVAEEPLRESAQAALIEAHLCEGNVIEARRQFDAFARMFWAELGLLPSPELYGRVGIGRPEPRRPIPNPATRQRVATPVRRLG
jgi:DNA-binding SARP family transcriptional activator